MFSSKKGKKAGGEEKVPGGKVNIFRKLLTKDRIGSGNVGVHYYIIVMLLELN